MAKLIVCTNCARHVRAQSTTCPFCENVMPRSGASPARAAIAVALGLTAATAIAFTPACAYGCPDASCSGSGGFAGAAGMGGMGGTGETTGITGSTSGGGMGGKVDTTSSTSGSTSGGGADGG